MESQIETSFINTEVNIDEVAKQFEVKMALQRNNDPDSEDETNDSDETKFKPLVEEEINTKDKSIEMVFVLFE